ncbi:MAG: hypothetical protein Q8934_09060 [Bacillota bacterium]|nr:hypothetical protein [Bacillota bacterium]
MNEIKLLHTDNYEIVHLECDGIFQGLFTNEEASGVMRAFLTLKSNSDSTTLNIVFESISKEELTKREVVWQSQK